MDGGTRTLRQENRAGGREPPAPRRVWASAVELEAQRDHLGRTDRAAVLARRPVAPVADEIVPSGIEEDPVGAADGLDRDHAAALVDGQLEAKHRLFTGQ